MVEKRWESIYSEAYLISVISPRLDILVLFWRNNSQIRFIDWPNINVKSIFKMQHCRNFIRIFVLWKNKRYEHYIATDMMRL